MSQNVNTTRILLIEDDEDDYLLTKEMLSDIEGWKFNLDWVSTYEFAANAIRRRKHDVILVDYRIGPRNGLEFLQEARSKGCKEPIIMLTGQADRELDIEVMSAGAADFLVKGETTPALLERSIRFAIDRNLQEEHIREQAHLLDLAQDAIIVCDLNDIIEYWNKGAEVLYGWPAAQALGKSRIEMLYQGTAEFDAAKESLLDNEEWSGELVQVTKGGREIAVSSRWTLLRDESSNEAKSILIINTDITEKKALAVQSMRAQRLESICTLATGIAHDLNNVLSPILMAVPLLRSSVTGEHALKLLDSIDDSSRRGTELVKQVMAFAHGGEGESTLMQIGHLITKCSEIAARTFPEKIDVHFKIEHDLWPIMGDAIPLEQMLMDLLHNARDAMLEGGKLDISAENQVVAKEMSRQYADARVGEFVCVTIKDSGVGIPKELIKKIFDPFFTTKTSGKGSGLGLSNALDIIKSHRGFMLVDSEPNKGSRFRIYLPKPEGGTQFISKSQIPNRGHGQRILVVDDEPVILEVFTRTLESAGYQVVSATDGAEGLEKFNAATTPFDIVVTDMKMPEMDGGELIETLSKRNPNIKIVGVSGTVEELKAQKRLASNRVVFLKKPFAPDRLLLTISQMLTDNPA